MIVGVSKIRKLALASVALPLTFGAVLSGTATVLPTVASASQKIFVNRVYFEGNVKAKDEQLATITVTQPRSVYDPALVQSDIERIKQAYNVSIGRANATVTARTVQITPTTVDVVYTITEGDKVGVEEIRFVGNNAYSAFTLKRQIQTVESGLFGWLRTTDTYDQVRLESDSEALRRFYVARGYPDFSVTSVNGELNANRDGYIVTFTVNEGDFYSFGKSSVESAIPGVEASRLEKEILSTEGSVYNGTKVDRTIEAMTDDLGRLGYPFAQIRPRGERDASGKLVNVTYVIEDGAPVYVERINIRGNTRTRDYVIRREFDMAEGDGYSQVEVDRALRRLRALNFFDSVKVTTEPGASADRVIVNVDVVDKSTGDFSIGGGYSTSDGFIGEASVTERNFLGKGQYLKIGGEFGETKTGFEFSFTEPYFLDQRIAAGIDLYSKNQDATDYTYVDTKTTGGTLRANFPITDNLSIGARYQLYQTDYSVSDPIYNDCAVGAPSTDACYDNGELSLAIKQQLGQRWVSALGYSVQYSTLDNKLNPTEGVSLEFNQDFAGLGGDAQWIKTTAQGRYYYPVADDLTVMLKAQGGYVTSWGDQLLVADHFNIGPDLVRGFAPSGIGPRDLAGGGAGNPLGGTIYYGATAELQFPILGLPREVGLRGALFADAGTVFGYEGVDLAGMDIKDSSSIRSSVGASVLWASPFGPIRFDYAFVLSKEDFDQEQAFRFSGGSSF